MDHLNRPLLAAYFEVLQTIKAKVPALIDRMTSVGPNSSKTSQTATEAMTGLLKRPWDPTLSSFSQQKLVCYDLKEGFSSVLDQDVIYWYLIFMSTDDCDHLY